MYFFRRLGMAFLLSLMLCLFVGAACADTVTLPADLTVIDVEAFENVGALDEVVLPEGAKRIESLAFANSGVRRVYLPATLEYIAKDAFSGCEGMSAWGQYGSYAEQFCMEQNIDFEAAMLDLSVFTVEFTSDEEATITGYTGTDETLYLPGFVDETHKITAIGEGAFMHAIFSTIMLPAWLKTIGKNAFWDCQKLEDVIFNEALERIGESAFASCRSLVEADLPDSVLYIEKSAFKYCTALNYFRYPPFLVEAGEGIFYYCTSLKSVEVTDGIMDFRAVFNKCNTIEEVVLPDTITSLPYRAFYECYALTTLRVTNGEEISGYENEITLPPYLKSIGEQAFSTCRNISLVNFNEGLNKIGNGAFIDCSALGSAMLPDSVTEIGMGAFNGCKELRSFMYPANLRWISTSDTAGILVGCNNLEHVEVPEGVTDLLTVFRGNTAIKMVTLPDTLQIIEPYAFYGCSALEDVFIAGGASHAEGACLVELPGSLKSTGSYSFCGCKAIKELRCNENLQSIKVCAFQNCSGLVEAVFNDSLELISDRAFANCTALEKADVPAGTRLEYDPFYNCPLLNQ